MIKTIKKFQIKLTPFNATKEWQMSTSNNQDLLLMDDTSSLEDEPVALEFIDYGSIEDTASIDNFECDIALEQQPDDLVNVRTGLKVTGLFYPDKDPINKDNTYKRMVYTQVKTMFYNMYRDPTKIWGATNIDFDLSKTKRKINDEFKLYDIPTNIYGEIIVPNTVTFQDTSLDDFFLITDDGNGNLLAGQNLFSHRQEIGNHANVFTVGNSSFCDVYFGISPGPIILPPSGSSVLTVTSGSAILSWSYSTNDENGFNIERSINGLSYNNIFVLSNPSSRSYTDTSVTSSLSGQEYWYRINAYNNGGVSPYSNTASIIFTSSSGSGPDPLAWWTLEETGNSNRVDAVNANILQDFSSGPQKAGIVSRAIGKIGFATSMSISGSIFTNGNFNAAADLENITTINPPDLTSGFHYLSWVAFDTWDNNAWYYIVNNTIDGPGISMQVIWSSRLNQILIVQDINVQHTTDFSASFTPVAGQFYFFNLFWDASDQKYGIQINNGAITKSSVAIPIVGAATDIFVDINLTQDGQGQGSGSNASIRVDEYAIYGKKLNSGQTDYIYNTGAGRTWPFTLPP